MGCGASTPAKPQAKPQAKPVPPSEAKAEAEPKVDDKSSQVIVTPEASTAKGKAEDVPSTASGDVDDGVQGQDQATKEVKKSTSVVRVDSQQTGRASGPDAYDDDTPPSASKYGTPADERGGDADAQMVKAPSSRGKASAAVKRGSDDEDAGEVPDGDEVLELPGAEASMGFQVTEMGPYRSRTSGSLSKAPTDA